MSMNHRWGHGFGQAQMPLVGLASKWDWPATVNRVSQTRRFDSSPTHRSFYFTDHAATRPIEVSADLGWHPSRCCQTVA
jgi:hypothetical protein